MYSEVLTRFERALDAGLDSSSSPVLALGLPEYLFGDLEALPELRERATKLRARLDVHPDLFLHSTDTSA